MVNMLQNVFEIEMQGKKKSIILNFTKDMVMLLRKGALVHMYYSNWRNEINIYYKVKEERVAGVEVVVFRCKCKGKHPTEFLPVDG